MLAKKLKTTAFIAFVFVLSSILIQGVYGQECPNLGVPTQELCLVMWERPRQGGDVSAYLTQRGATQIVIDQSFGDHYVNLTVDLVTGAGQIGITVNGAITRDLPGDNYIGLTVQGGLSPGPIDGEASLALEGDATGASVITLGGGAGYDIGVGEPGYFPFPRVITQTNYGPAAFNIIENRQPLPEWGEWVAVKLVLHVDITDVGTIVTIPAGSGINTDNPGGIDPSCLGLPTNYVPLCEEVEGLASADTPVYFGDNLVAADSLFFQVPDLLDPEPIPFDLTLVPEGVDLWAALFRTHDEMCDQYVESRLFPADVGATETFTLEHGMYYIVIHRDLPGLCVPFTFFVGYDTCQGFLEWAGPEFNVDEDAGTAEITVVRRFGSLGDASVGYFTSDGTAEAGTDYTAASGTLNWADGDNSPLTFTIPIIEDILIEGNEMFNLELIAPTGALLGDLFTAVVTIEDNDEEFTISGQVTDAGGFPKEGVILTFSNGDVGTATTDSDGNYSQSVPSGWSGIVVPTLAGYYFDPSSRTYTNVTSDIPDQDYAASRILYTLLISATAGGTTDPAPGDYLLEHGTEVTVTAISDSGNVFSHWSGNASGTEPSVTITMDADKSITANFIPTQFTLTIAAGTGGTTDPAPGSYTYDYGIEVSVTAIPSSRYEFSHWSGDASGTELSVTITMDGDKSITANFSQTQAMLTIAAETGGTTNPAPGDYVYDIGTQVTVTAIPDSGYNFSGWSGDATGTTNPITITMDADKSITANFSKIQYTLTIAAGTGGTTNPAPGNYTYDTGIQVVVTAIPSTGYNFSHWSGDASGATNPITITMDADKSITANFSPIQHTLTIEAGPDGSTDPEPGIYTHDYGTEVEVRALPDSGYNFSSWSGDAAGSTNPITITMDRDKSIKANFTYVDIETDIGQGCPMLTTAYGTPLHPQLDIIRDFRDKYLMPSKFGRALVDLYYKYSPYASDLIAKNRVLRLTAWINLVPLIAFSYSMLNFGPAISAVMIVFVFALPVFLVSFFRRRLRRKERMISIIMNYSLMRQGAFQKAWLG